MQETNLLNEIACVLELLKNLVFGSKEAKVLTQFVFKLCPFHGITSSLTRLFLAKSDGCWYCIRPSTTLVLVHGCEDNLLSSS